MSPSGSSRPTNPTFEHLRGSLVAPLTLVLAFLGAPGDAASLADGRSDKGAKGARLTEMRGRGESRFLHLHRAHGPVGPHPLPTFQKTFEFGGHTYTERLVGNPTGPGTTVVHALLLPLRLDFGGGVVYDATSDMVSGRTPLDWVASSPLFVPTQFSAGSTALGTTQWTDAYLRANFWNEDGGAGRHLFLDPVLAPTRTLTVPPEKEVVEVIDSIEYKGVDLDWFDAQVQASLSELNPDPASVAVIVMPPSLWVFSGSNGYGGYHSAATLSSRPNGPEQTYVFAGGFEAFGQTFPDAGVGWTLSHEVSEWMNDPFVDNDVPPWTIFESLCQGNLEVADYTDELIQLYWAQGLPGPDPFFLATTSRGVSYLWEGPVFFDWFTRRSASRSVNGWFSFNDAVTSSSSDSCYDSKRFEIQTVDIPGSQYTVFEGINDREDIVGTYQDSAGVLHGLLISNGKMTTLDVPGSYGTYATGINDARTIVGTYLDVSGGYHGFTYSNDHFSTLDPVPDAFTWLNAIAKSGDIGGGYFPLSGSPVESGLLLHGGVPQSILPLSATDAEIEAFSPSGQIAGVFGSWGNGFLDTGFVGTPGNFTPVIYAGPDPAPVITYPGGLTDDGALSGYVYDELGAYNGFYLKDGVWSRIGYGAFTTLYGMNSRGVTVGSALGGRWHGLIVRPRTEDAEASSQLSASRP